MFARSISILATVFLARTLPHFAGLWTTCRSWLSWWMVLKVQVAQRSWRATGGLHPSHACAHRCPSAPDERYAVNDPSAISSGYWAINRVDTKIDGSAMEVSGVDPKAKKYNNILNNGYYGTTAHAEHTAPGYPS